MQAALASGFTFTIAAALPLIAAILAPSDKIIPTVVIATLICLAGLGALGAQVGGAPKLRAMQIIDELEPDKRGVYAGAVGYLGFHGDMDLAIESLKSAATDFITKPISWPTLPHRLRYLLRASSA